MSTNQANQEVDMARNTEKDKKDKDSQAAVPADGYAPPPPAPPSYEPPEEAFSTLEAEDDGGVCDLRIVVFRGDDPARAPGAPRIARARVTLTGSSFSQPKTTDGQGEVCWTDLPPGDYWVEVAAPKGHQRGGTRREQVTLIEGEEAELHIGLEPEEAVLQLLAYHDAQRCGDPGGQTRIKNLRFDVYDGSSLLDSGKTGDDGTATLPLHHTGWVEVRMQGRVHTGGATLLPAGGDRQRVLLEPGKECAVRIAYVAGHAELTVEAVLADGDCEAAPLPGVGLSLYAPGSGVPVRTARTDDWPVVFSDLAAGPYTLAVHPPPNHRGHAVELADGAQQRSTVVVEPGSSTPLTLRFRPARGQVKGCVRGLGSQEGWEGIRLRLVPPHGGTPLRTATEARGEFLFTDVPAGPYELELADAKIPHGLGHWMLAPGSPARQKVAVQPGAPVSVEPFLLAPDEHTLTIQVFDPDNKPLPYAAVEVLAENGELVGNFSTNETGTSTVELERAGNYQVRFLDDGRIVHRVQVNKGATVSLHARRGGGATSRPGPSGGGFQDAVVDIPYPLLTESAAMGGASWSGGAPSGADLGQTVQEALRSVLNWRATGYNGDAKGFVTALNQSFSVRQIEGHTEFTWTPRSYAAVQSGLGALTGAQASIFTRAKVALDQALPLLEGLYPLRADADPQNTEAIRAIVRSGLTELVNELGIEGGPRVLRVDDLFRQLSGYTNSLQFNPNPEQVKGQLAQLAAVFGLKRNQVNTIDEEQNLTNFLIIVDYTLGLQQSWLTQRGFFTRGSGSEPFLGTQLVLVERSLAVIAESVREAYMAMDSVFLGREERQVVELAFPGEPSLFVAELLGWIDQVASNEGPQLIKDGGKQGVISFQPTIERLAQLAAGALIPPQNPADLPAGYRTARVQRALQELADHLDEASRLVQQIQQAA